MVVLKMDSRQAALTAMCSLDLRTRLRSFTPAGGKEARKATNGAIEYIGNVPASGLAFARLSLRCGELSTAVREELVRRAGVQSSCRGADRSEKTLLSSS